MTSRSSAGGSSGSPSPGRRAAGPAAASACSRPAGDRHGPDGRQLGCVHAGIYYAAGSLKARLCVQGAAELYAYAAERGVPVKAVGKLIVARTPVELPRLDELERRGRANGVPGCGG